MFLPMVPTEMTLKRFDFAVEVSKQLLTIGSALIFGLATFTDKIFVHEDSNGVFALLLTVYFLLIVSIGAGIFGLGALVNSVEDAEKKGTEKSKDFVSVFDGAAALLAMIQQLAVFAAFLVLFATFAIDKWCY